MDRGDLPDGVRGPDGRTEPFEPERIARRLFAAAGRIGRADAFVARELTEGVLHFLTAEAVGSVTTPAQIAEVVVKVVRELGHPALANAYEENSRPRHASSFASEPRRFPVGPCSLLNHAAELFPRDLVSAHEEGLIHLSGRATPNQFAGVLIDGPPAGLFDDLRNARGLIGEFVAVDAPEYELAQRDGEPGQLAQSFIDEARKAADTVGLTIYLNLNSSAPPARLAEGSGPLFPPGRKTPVERVRKIALELAERADGPEFSVWWHLAASDGGVGEAPIPVHTACTEFVIDRPKTPVQLGPGIDRQQPTALIRVGVNLAQLVQMTGGPPIAPDVFLRRVGSLARFAKTAGHVKQDYLRRHGPPAVREGFLLERACLVLVPLGLVDAARSTDRPPVEFAREILRALRAAAENDRPRMLTVRIDSVITARDWDEVAGPGPTARQQIRVGSQLHAVTGSGSLEVVLQNGVERAEALRLAVESSVIRMRFKEADAGLPG